MSASSFLLYPLLMAETVMYQLLASSRPLRIADTQPIHMSMYLQTSQSVALISYTPTITYPDSAIMAGPLISDFPVFLEYN